MKIAYIIPGSGESASYPEYKKIASFFKKRKIKPIPIKIDWNYKVMSNYVEQFLSQVKYENPDYILGFSFGAMIAFISSNKIKPKTMILCSLSPYFKEDLPKIKDWWKKIAGKKLIKDLDNFSFNKISKNIKSKTILLVGEKEAKICVKRSKETHKKLKNSKLIIIKDTRHKIRDKRYLDAIKEVINNLP